MAERYPEAELVLDDELLYDEVPRRSMLRRSEERAEDIVREGEVLAGKYRVERIPGRNGLGVLVQVRHLELGQEVTLKFLVPEACAYPEFVQRFVREARSAVRIQGEHVARVTDVGRLESGAPYMVREYLRGPDLAEVLKVRGPLPISEAVDYVIQACEGVAEGHALGVVHRNLRPTSLVVARRSDGTPLVKVFDFAASESLHVNPFTERAVSLVGTSAIMASLPYLAPEQIRDPHDVDFRADVYSMGAVLFELLAGSPVYAADAAPALLAQVAADPAPSLRTLRAELPGELDHIVLRCLAKNRAIRYASVADLVAALAPFASHEVSSSIERIARLGKRTSKLPELGESRVPSPLPPAPLPSVPASSIPARGRHATLPLTSYSSPNSMHEDVTTINPYASYSAPVVINPDPARSAGWRDPTRTQPLPAVQAPARSEPARAEPRETAVIEPLPAEGATEPSRREVSRRTPQPPPLRSSSPPPLRQSVAAPMPSVPPPPLPGSRLEPTVLPPSSRTSMSGLSRSWAVPDQVPAPLLTPRRLIALGAVAAGATLAIVLSVRPLGTGYVAAAAPPPAAAPAGVAAGKPAPQPAPVAVASPVVPVAAQVAPVSAPVAVSLPLPVVAGSPAPVAVAPPAVAPPVAAVPAVAALVPAPVAPAAVMPVVAAALPVQPKAPPVARRPLAREVAPAESPRKSTTAPDKIASARPAAGDLFDDPK